MDIKVGNKNRNATLSFSTILRLSVKVGSRVDGEVKPKERFPSGLRLSLLETKEF